MLVTSPKVFIDYTKTHILKDVVVLVHSEYNYCYFRGCVVLFHTWFMNIIMIA